MNEPKSDGFSIASMICGIAGLLLSGVMGLILGIIALVMRSIYKGKNNGEDNSETQVGRITGIIAIVVFGVVMTVGTVIFGGIFIGFLKMIPFLQ